MVTDLASKGDVRHLNQMMAIRFDEFESRLSLKLQALESRIVLKLGMLMTVQFGVAIALFVLLR